MSVPVHEVFGGKVWEGEVQVFAVDHSKVKRCYAWSYPGKKSWPSRGLAEAVGLAPGLRVGSSARTLSTMDGCIYCELARRCANGIRVSTPRESATWRAWREQLHLATHGRRNSQSTKVIPARAVPTAEAWPRA